MPKYKKGKKRQQLENEEKSKSFSDQKRDIYNSSIRSLILGGIILILSLIFNGNMIQFGIEPGTAIDVILTLIKSLIIILFYTFVFLGIANSMELRGKPASMKIVILISLLSLFQSIRSASVFWISLAGILLMNLYFWVLQSKVESI
jgi:cation transport ATPase